MNFLYSKYFPNFASSHPFCCLHLHSIVLVVIYFIKVQFLRRIQYSLLQTSSKYGVIVISYWFFQSQFWSLLDILPLSLHRSHSYGTHQCTETEPIIYQFLLARTDKVKLWLNRRHILVLPNISRNYVRLSQLFYQVGLVSSLVFVPPTF